MLFLTSFFLCFIITRIRSVELQARDACSDNYSKCSPPGASSTGVPAIGPELSSLYTDILSSIQGIKIKERDVQEIGPKLHSRDAPNDFCCADGTSCLLLQDLSVPFCYDKFTTNFFLPGGFFGTVVSGNYNSSNGDMADLLTGNFTLADGTTGNIYGSESSPSRPNTSTLTLPTQFTGSGVGNVIPLTALGEQVTFTTTIPGTTIPPTTISVETAGSTVVSGKTVIEATSESVTTLPGTTVPPRTSTITTHAGTTGNTNPTTKSSSAPNTLQLDATFSLVAHFSFLLFVMLSFFF